MALNWQGVSPAVTRQYNNDLSINFEAARQMIDAIIKEGVDGIIALCTVGENASYTREEKIAILKAVKEVVADRVPVLSKLCEQLAGRGSELTRAPRMPLTGEERANVERIFHEANNNRIDLSKFNLD